MNKLLLIADDLTGALDSGIQFVEKGIKSEIIIRKPDKDNIDLSFSKDCQVLIIDTETRHVTPSQAYEIVLNLVKQAKKLGFEYFFKKTDSSLRGNISSELKALLDFSGKNVHFIPAYPKMNRITKHGIHYVEGVEVSESVFGKDPFSPVLSSFIPNLFSDEVKVTLENIKNRISDPSIIIYDSTTDDDIDEILSRFSEDEMKLLAGCAGLAEKIPNFINFKRNENKTPKLFDSTIIFSGSLNEVTEKQLAYAQKEGIKHYVLNECQIMNKNFTDSQKDENILEKIKKEVIYNKNVLVSVNNKNKLIDFPRNREEVGRILGELIYQLVNQNPEANLFVIGGDTAVSFIYQYEDPHLIPIKFLGDGVVLSQLETEYFKLNLITKSGGFGDEKTIVETLKKFGSLK